MHKKPTLLGTPAVKQPCTDDVHSKRMEVFLGLGVISLCWLMACLMWGAFMISQNPGEFFRFAQQALPVLFFSAAMLFAIVCNALWYGLLSPHGQRIKAMRLGAQSIYLGVKVGLVHASSFWAPISMVECVAHEKWNLLYIPVGSTFFAILLWIGLWKTDIFKH